MKRKEGEQEIRRVEIFKEKFKRSLMSPTQLLDYFILHILCPNLILIISTSPQGTGYKKGYCLPFLLKLNSLLHRRDRLLQRQIINPNFSFDLISQSTLPTVQPSGVVKERPKYGRDIWLNSSHLCRSRLVSQD